ncbi:putative bromodomain associated [Lyophyllum shimeji]|uniref:Bromodomain associated n=1 Tax=Lyophyllum shimeji TaxID=47721 RepID=A0A9P3PY04_LYOSH|nr:putative bromodomain associated [Lyophyllum shimeji]
MENAGTKLLESATHRTLHAHAFSRTSTQASLVLTDLLSRYLALLSGTCAKYAALAGRNRLNVHDALEALDELGVSVDELNEYAATEGKELARYAVWSGRRVEDLHEYRAQLHDGLRQDRDDAIPLMYGPCPDLDIDDSDVEDELSEDEVLDTGPTAMTEKMDVDTLTPPRTATPPRISTPPLPLSPISNPSSPSHPRKRPRKASWQPPEHIPDFLPPFPTIVPDAPETSPATESPYPTQPTIEMPPPVPLPAESADTEKPTAPAPALTSTAASDYLVQVPYSQSSLSQVAEWHLPSAPPRAMQVAPCRGPRLATLQTEPALFAAYHHILTHPPPPNGIHPTLPRHRVAMALLHHMQKTPRWDPPDTLYASVGPCPPRMASVGPTYPMALGDEGKREGKDREKEVKFPPTLPRAVTATERLAPMVSQQGSRIPDLARTVLPPTILSRTSRLTHPPPLQRGTKLLVYGGGVPAPWNANALPAGDAVPGTPGGGKEKDGEEGAAKAVLPDARLYATWESETKDFRVPLATRGRGRGSGVISLGRRS